MLGIAQPGAALRTGSAIVNAITQHNMHSTKHQPKCDITKDARSSVSGCHSGWLAKAKSTDARAKWFSSSTRRFFTIDYDSQILFYSRSESDKKVSQHIGFRDIIGACPLPESGSNAFGFVLRTRNRDYELFAESEWDVASWVAGLNRARDSVDSAASDSTSAGESSASGTSTPASQGSPRSCNPSLDHGPRGPKGGYPEACAVVRQRSPSPVREDPFEALDALEAMMGVGAVEVPKPIVPREPASAGQSHQGCDASNLLSQCGTAHVAALALTQHNVEADAWDSDDDDDEDVIQEDVGSGKQPQMKSFVDFTKSHNALADVWDSDDDDEDSLAVQPVQALAQETAESKASKVKRRTIKHGDVTEAQDERKARKEARREARRAEGETEVEREARREARRERRSKRSALEESTVGATQVEPLQ